MRDIWTLIKTTFRKKPWLLPPVIVILLVVIIAIAAGNPTVAPFLYTIF